MGLFTEVIKTTKKDKTKTMLINPTAKKNVR